VVYFDSAYVAKFYLDEPESDAVRARAVLEREVCCCVLGQAEVVSVFHRKWREKSRTKAEFRILMDQFEADCSAGLWTWLSMSSAVIKAATSTYGRIPESVFLRSADAIHLACAAEAGFKELYSNDRHLLSAASHFGLSGVVIS
jgi:predicted nucleic acid-binding protein